MSLKVPVLMKGRLTSILYLFGVRTNGSCYLKEGWPIIINQLSLSSSIFVHNISSGKHVKHPLSFIRYLFIFTSRISLFTNTCTLHLNTKYEYVLENGQSLVSITCSTLDSTGIVNVNAGMPLLEGRGWRSSWSYGRDHFPNVFLVRNNGRE